MKIGIQYILVSILLNGEDKHTFRI